MVENKKFKRLSDDEISWIKATFKDNEQGLVTLRKILLQTAEAETPIGFYRDSWAGLDLKNLDEGGRVLAVASHQSMLNQLESGLRTVSVIAEQSIEEMEAAVTKAKQNSSK
jgi:hypothetical protein